MRAGIVGAGVMGQWLAFVLRNAGWEVTLFESGGNNNCSHAASGLLSPLAELEKNDLLIYTLGIEALQEHWPKLMKQLKTRIYFRQQGSLMLAHLPDRAELLRTLSVISSKQPALAAFQKCDAAQLSALEPQLSKFQEAYYFPEEGQIDNQQLLKVLAAELVKRGVQWFHYTPVTALQPGKIWVKAKAYLFDWVMDCRGLGAKTSFKDLRAMRGELLWLHAPQVRLSRPLRLIHPRYSLYVAPRPKQIYLVGASEIEAEDYSPISVRTTLELLSAVYSLNAAFAEARLIKTVTQCRPVLANHLPRIHYADGYLAVNGLYRHGFLIAPTLAQEVIRGLQGGMAARRYPQVWEQSL